MTALAAERGPVTKAFYKVQLTLASGKKGWKGGAAGLNLSTGKVEPMSANSNLDYIGLFEATYDATAGDTACVVNLQVERWCVAYVNDTTVTSAMVGKIAYFADDQTVSASGSVPAGRIWAVSTTDGVFIEIPPGKGHSVVRPAGKTLAFASNDIVLAGSDVINNATYVVPATAGNSTITLPTTGVLSGTTITFTADGTVNAHTVTYREGTTALTAALTASKRHQAILTYNGTTWTAIAGVSP